MEIRYTTYVTELRQQPNIIALLGLLKEYDEATFHHCINVAELTERITRLLKWSKEDIVCAVMGALLHDIGKIIIPLSILKKTDLLTESEMNEMKKHPVYGCELARYCGIPLKVCFVILNHHEREDGSGYVFRLQKTEISKEVKVVALADVFCAMTENRCYKEAYQKKHALDIIHNQSLLFDNRLIAILDKLISEHETIEFRQQTNEKGAKNSSCAT